MPIKQSSTRKVRVAIVDDHPVVRAGLATLISRDPRYEVCGEADDLAGGLKLFGKEEPDVMIVDISLQSGSGLDLIRRLAGRRHDVRMLVVSMYDDALYAERAVRAGASGYINKQEAGRKILAAIEQVCQGKIYVSDKVASRMLSQSLARGKRRKEDPVTALSDRELEVYAKIGRGLSTSQIAAHLHVGVKTVETYRQRIKHKLGLDSSSELVRDAMHWSLEPR